MIHLTSEGVGCITHAGGIGKLIHARGPQLHKSYPEKEIYLEARVILVRQPRTPQALPRPFS